MSMYINICNVNIPAHRLKQPLITIPLTTPELVFKVGLASPLYRCRLFVVSDLSIELGCSLLLNRIKNSSIVFHDDSSLLGLELVIDFNYSAANDELIISPNLYSRKTKLNQSYER